MKEKSRVKITIAADHGGFELKKKIVVLLQNLNYAVDDIGCHSPDSVDYPPFAEAVCSAVISGSSDLGILVCGSGIGMSMAANRHREIRAALCQDLYSARMSREHNNANVLCLGSRVIGDGVAEEIVKTWLATDFAGGRHELRIRQFSD
ncbi:ribose 5-phosphate isomerase B [Desulfopila inferna]|uniref:ribose 5-phosphate isomerase B n=1 Tax=Desulfopila inferna TaxID=468528 RepID=UPI0019660C99|nr:ribose 5-phosphate isomerase B [Desulfopila inferna]MBM9604241.1 ribose 5-phosphate isomerase B [Desulfopila inferna]